MIVFVAKRVNVRSVNLAFQTNYPLATQFLCQKIGKGVVGQDAGVNPIKMVSPNVRYVPSGNHFVGSFAESRHDRLPMKPLVGGTNVAFCLSQIVARGC